MKPFHPINLLANQAPCEILVLKSVTTTFRSRQQKNRCKLMRPEELN